METDLICKQAWTLYKQLERKAKPIIANQKEDIGDKAKEWRWSPNHNK